MPQTVKLFCGYDSREAIGYAVFSHSVIARASRPVCITPLSSMGLPQGSNTFTLSRFLVPHLMGFKGHAIFADACDMLMLDDVAKLDALYDPKYAVQVVKHSEYESAHVRKYIGTEMECAQTNYPRKNWASLMIINCEHDYWWAMGPNAISHSTPMGLLQFDCAHPEQIGALPPEWNVLVDEGQEDANAKCLHWTAGIPSFQHYKNARRSGDWFRELNRMGGVYHG